MSTTRTNKQHWPKLPDPCLALGGFKDRLPEGRGGGGRRWEGVIEEVKQRSMFDTALILLLSVKRFQHSNNTGP